MGCSLPSTVCSQALTAPCCPATPSSFTPDQTYLCANSLQPDESTMIEMNESVALTFALRYLNSFAKATSLSPTVVRWLPACPR